MVIDNSLGKHHVTLLPYSLQLRFSSYYSYLQCYPNTSFKLKARFCLPADQVQKKSTDSQGVLPDLLLCKWDDHVAINTSVSLIKSPLFSRAFPSSAQQAALSHSRSLPGCKLLRFQHIPERSASQIQSTAGQSLSCVPPP